MIRLYDIYAFVQNLNICKTQYTKSTECMMCRKKKKKKKKKVQNVKRYKCAL